MLEMIWFRRHSSHFSCQFQRAALAALSGIDGRSCHCRVDFNVLYRQFYVLPRRVEWSLNYIPHLPTGRPDCGDLIPHHPTGRPDCGDLIPHLPTGRPDCGDLIPHLPTGRPECGDLIPHLPTGRPDCCDLIPSGFNYRQLPSTASQWSVRAARPSPAVLNWIRLPTTTPGYSWLVGAAESTWIQLCSSGTDRPRQTPNRWVEFSRVRSNLVVWRHIHTTDADLQKRHNYVTLFQ